MAWVRRSKRGLTYLGQPPLTQTLGPWLASPPANMKYSRKLTREMDLIGALVDQLPEYAYLSQSFAPEITTWLPLYWRGFQQSTAYTYRLDNLHDHDRIWRGFEDRSRGAIRKATKSGVVVEIGDEIDTLLKLVDMTFARQTRGNPIGHDYARRLHKACQQKDAGAVIIARGLDGKPHAGAFIVWNEHCAYYLLGGGDPALRASGAMNLVLWQAIQIASTVSSKFDFEGSMVAPIEYFFRGFGAIQTPYLRVSHTRSRLLALAEASARVWRTQKQSASGTTSA